MSLFLLTPTNIEMPEWASSSCKKPVQVEAEDEAQARYLAAQNYCPDPGGNDIKLARPWLRTDLAQIAPIDRPKPGVPLIRKQARVKRAGRAVPTKIFALNLRSRHFG